MHLVERFTRADKGTLHYEFTVDDDPATWTGKWSASNENRWRRDLVRYVEASLQRFAHMMRRIAVAADVHLEQGRSPVKAGEGDRPPGFRG
jgi:hypothetical protein